MSPRGRPRWKGRMDTDRQPRRNLAALSAPLVWSGGHDRRRIRVRSDGRREAFDIEGLLEELDGAELLRDRGALWVRRHDDHGHVASIRIPLPPLLDEL